MIEPFFFKQDQLFGCYHPAADVDSQRLLIVCPPLFDEYKRSYRALSDLANACAEQGVHVLRFDYYGTGESQGLLDQATAGVWIEDIRAAIEEGVSLSGATQVMLLGVRFGAILASQIQHEHVKRYIFWDPIASGASYLRCLDEVNRMLKQNQSQLARDINMPFENIVYENFHLSSVMINEMAALTFNQRPIENIAQSHIITTDPLVYDSKMYVNCEFPGLIYSWPAYHQGLFSPKPVLDAIGRRILQ
jgi:hypothetical protein